MTSYEAYDGYWKSQWEKVYQPAMDIDDENLTTWYEDEKAWAITRFQKVDEVDNPDHYTSHPSGIECIEITEHMNFNLGNAVKYIWRAGLKSEDPTKDLEKAAWYINRELERLRKG